ncbi:hypothetical protein ES703_06877 [subsurface metagenome]
MANKEDLSHKIRGEQKTLRCLASRLHYGVVCSGCVGEKLCAKLQRVIRADHYTG